MDDAPSPAASRTAPAAERASDPDAIREAYLRARFPGVIRALSDLDDPGRVNDAAWCYAADGRADRAQELLALALAEHPDLGERLPTQPVREAAGHHAALIHRLLATGAAARTRTS